MASISVISAKDVRGENRAYIAIKIGLLFDIGLDDQELSLRQNLSSYLLTNIL